MSSTCHSQLPQVFHSEGRLAYAFATRSLVADVAGTVLAGVAGAVGEGAGDADAVAAAGVGVEDAAGEAVVVAAGDVTGEMAGASPVRLASGADAVLLVSAASAFSEGTAGESDTAMAKASSAISIFFADASRPKAVLHLFVSNCMPNVSPLRLAVCEVLRRRLVLCFLGRHVFL